MILSDRDIKEYLKWGKIKITPLDDPETQIQPSSVDLTFGDQIIIFFDKETIDTKKDDPETYTARVNLGLGYYIIEPGKFILATTREEIELDTDLVARIEGRSSLGRLGLTMHVTAGYIDPGFKGKVTLEISNLGKNAVKLYVGQRVCQIVFEQMKSHAEKAYGHPDRKSKYMGQKKPEPSKINQDK